MDKELEKKGDYKDMVIILKDKHDLDTMPTGQYVTAHVILLFDEDNKGFTVIKHRSMNNANEHYHMSDLTNIITAGKKG